MLCLTYLVIIMLRVKLFWLQLLFFHVYLWSKEVETCSGSSQFSVLIFSFPETFLSLFYLCMFFVKLSQNSYHTQFLPHTSLLPALWLLHTIFSKFIVFGILVNFCCALTVCEYPWGLRKSYVRSFMSSSYPVSGADQAICAC